MKPFKPRSPDAADGTWRMAQEDVNRVQEFRKCIECFLCQDVCHVLREHSLHNHFIGPRFLVYSGRAGNASARQREPAEGPSKTITASGTATLRNAARMSAPKISTITDNAIIPLKERVVDEHFDPLRKLFRIFGK